MLDFFEDDAGEWRWRVKGENGEITATSEGYVSRSNAERGWHDHCRIVVGLAGIDTRHVQS